MENIQRQIKFRAWDKQREHLEVVTSIDWDTQYVYFKRGLDNVGETQTERQIYALCTLEQFTGLLDKNGKEIYEGDILSLSCSSNKDHAVAATVEWYGDLARFIPAIHDKEVLVVGGSMEGKKVSMREMHSWCGMHYCFSYPHHLEVIGNIHENPDLVPSGDHKKEA